MQQRFSHFSRGRRAVALILTMYVVLVLSLLAHSLAFDMQIEARLTTTFRDRFISEQTVRRGISRAIADLRNDMLIGHYAYDPDEDSGSAPNLALFAGPPQPDAYGDVWNDGQMEPRQVEVATPEGLSDKLDAYEIMVVDEESKININSDSKQMPAVIQLLLMELGLDQARAHLISMAIQDWKDADNSPATPDAENESAFYTSLVADVDMDGVKRPADWKFRPKNGPFGSVEELLQVPGITPELFFGSAYRGPNAPAPFFPSRPLRAGTLDSRPGLRDLVTVRASELNINTATVPVMTAVFGVVMGNVDQGRTIAENIARYRGMEPSSFSEDKVFSYIEDLKKVPDCEAVSAGQVESVVPLTVRSNRFTIYCRAGRFRRDRSSFSSLDRHRTDDVEHGVSAVVGVRREQMSYPLAEGEAQQSAVLNMQIPGYPIEVKSSSDIRGSGRESGFQRLVETDLDEELWGIPVVYMEYWRRY